MLDSPADTAAMGGPGRFPRSPPDTGHGHFGFAGDASGVAILLAVLRRRRLAIGLTALLVPLLAWIAIGQITPRYSATATVLYEPNGFAARELQSILRVDPTTEAVMFSQAEIVRSLRTAERVADDFGLQNLPEFNADLRPVGLMLRWLKQVRTIIVTPLTDGGAAAEGHDVDDSRNAVAFAVREAITVTTPKSSRVLEITFTSRDRRLAAAVANSIAAYYIDDQLEVKIAAVRRATSWLQTRASELSREVADAENRIAAYRASRGLAKGVQAGLDTEQVSRLSLDLAQARNDLAQIQARVDAARGKAGAAAQAAIAPSVAPMRALQDQVAGQLQALLVERGPRHPEALALQRQLAEASRSVAAEIARIVVAASAELRATRERVVTLEVGLRDLRGTQEKNEQAQVALNTLERDAEASRTLLQSVLERTQQTAQQAAIEMPDARLIAAAVAPVEPSFPRPLPWLAAAAAFGIFFGLLLAYLLELADVSFRSGEDVRAFLGLPCFALVPEIPRRVLGPHRIDEYAAYHPLSVFAEQLRALRAALWLGVGTTGSENGAVRPRVIAITAARPAEGKTTIALALGRAAALAGERVAILDCDIREPMLGRLLGADGAPGLADCLLGHAALADVIRRDRLTTLDCVPAGASQAHLLGLLMSDAMAVLLRSLRQQYDLVLLDVPPALAMADARIVARLADATLLCLRWRSTPRAVVRNSLELLDQAQAHLIGVALTRVDVRAHVRSGFADAEVYHPRYGGYFRP